MLWKINLNRTLVDKTLKKLFEAKIGEDRNHFGMTLFSTKKISKPFKGLSVLVQDSKNEFK